MRYPKYGGMLDWALVVPIAGLVSCTVRKRDKRSEVGSVLVLLHAAAVISVLVVEDPTTRWGAAAGAVAIWMWTLHYINTDTEHNPASLRLVEALSPTSYLLAYPLFFTGKNKLEYAIGALILVVHAITVPTIVILMWASKLHEAWGCYGSQRSIYDYDGGMCGQWNIYQIPICRDLQGELPPGEPIENFDCTSDTKPWEFFGTMLHRILSYEMVAINFWVVAMIEVYATAD